MWGVAVRASNAREMKEGMGIGKKKMRTTWEEESDEEGVVGWLKSLMGFMNQSRGSGQGLPRRNNQRHEPQDLSAGSNPVSRPENPSFQVGRGPRGCKGN